MPKSTTLREAKPIIIIISHGDNVANRLLHNKLAKRMNGDIAFFVKYQHTDKEGVAFYSLEMLDNSRNNPDKKSSADQVALGRFLAGRCRFLASRSNPNKPIYTLDGIVNTIFSATRRVDFSITGKGLISCFNPGYTPKLYLFLDANLTLPGTDIITEEFHNTVHSVTRTYRKIYSDLAEVYIYPFSQQELACVKANDYLGEQLTVDGFKLDSEMLIQHAVAADRIVLERFVRFAALDEEVNEESTLREESTVVCRCCCFSLFSNKNPATVVPLSGVDAHNNQSNQNNNIQGTDMLKFGELRN